LKKLNTRTPNNNGSVGKYTDTPPSLKIIESGAENAIINIILSMEKKYSSNIVATIGRALNQKYSWTVKTILIAIKTITMA